MKFVLLINMKENGFLFLMINEFSNITFPFFNARFDEDRNTLNLSIARNEFTKALQKNRRCRIEFGFEKTLEAEIRSMTDDNGDMVLLCTLIH